MHQHIEAVVIWLIPAQDQAGQIPTRMGEGLFYWPSSSQGEATILNSGFDYLLHIVLLLNAPTYFVVPYHRDFSSTCQYGELMVNSTKIFTCHIWNPHLACFKLTKLPI